MAQNQNDQRNPRSGSGSGKTQDGKNKQTDPNIPTADGGQGSSSGKQQGKGPDSQPGRQQRQDKDTIGAETPYDDTETNENPGNKSGSKQNQGQQGNRQKGGM